MGSCCQQFLAEAIVGEDTGKVLKAIPVRLESYGKFYKSSPSRKLLRPAFSFKNAEGANLYRVRIRQLGHYFSVGQCPKALSLWSVL